MICSGEYVNKCLNLAAGLCSLNFFVSFKQTSRVERVLHFSRYSGCQSSSESHCFLGNDNRITTSHFSVFFSALTSATEVMSGKLWLITRWVATGCRRDSVAFISNTTGLIALYPWQLTNSQLYTVLRVHKMKATWKVAWMKRTTSALLPGALISTIHFTYSITRSGFIKQ